VDFEILIRVQSAIPLTPYTVWKMSLLRLAIIRRTTTDFDNFNQNMPEKVSIIRNILFSLLTKLVFLHYLVKQETGQPDSYIYASGYIETDKEL